MAKFCTNCGMKLTNGASFCQNCGVKVELPAEPFTQTEPLIPPQTIQPEQVPPTIEQPFQQPQVQPMAS